VRVDAAVGWIALRRSETVAVHTKPSQRAGASVSMRFILQVAANAGLQHGVLPDPVEELSRPRVIEADGANVVAAKLHAQSLVLHQPAGPPVEPAMTQL